MKISTRNRRDWFLLVLIILIGIILMLIAGRFAIRISPLWSITAEMRSDLDPNLAPKRKPEIVQPIDAGILTPYDAIPTTDPDSGDVAFPPFVVIEPNATLLITVIPSPTEFPTIQPTASPLPTATKSATATQGSIIVFPTPTKTRTPTLTKTAAPTKTATGTLTKTPTPTLTKTATASATITSTATVTFTPSVTPTATVPPIVSTLDLTTLTFIAPPPPIGTPDGINRPIPSGSYAIVDLGVNALYVSGLSETNYDLVYYESEYNNTGNILLDAMIVGISQFADAHIYYQVSNWGDNVRDMNTNVDTNILPDDLLCLAPNAPECDNRKIPKTLLYPSPSGTGILIDVENALSAPPPDTYQYLVFICPPNSGDPAQVDSIELLDEPR